jgi:alpha-beta hydrolase superfamily lysophospholipase
VAYSRYYVSYLSDGLKIYALMTVPSGEKPPTGWPVIIFNHGYIPPGVYRTTERYIAYVDLIARSGYIVFRSDYRGHDRSEGEASGAYSTPGYTVDVLNAVASLKRSRDADPNRIGMWGHSMGGYITLRSMVINKDIKAGVIWAGVVAPYADMLTRWRRGSGAAPTPTPAARFSWRRSFIEVYGSPEDNPEFWNTISRDPSNSITARQTRMCRSNFQSCSFIRCLRQINMWNSTSMKVIITIFRIPLASPCSVPSNFLTDM